MLRVFPMLTLLAIPAIAPIALAGEGVREINQTCATGPGCFLGDLPGLPVTISARGSYRLTGNIGFTSGASVPSENFIEITAADVHLDLGGFSIRCSNVLTGTPCPNGTVAGILVAPGADRVHIHNGAIFGTPGNGIRSQGNEALHIERVAVASTGGDGISASTGARIEDCTVLRNREAGIRAGLGSTVVGNLVAENGGDGIAVGSQSIVSRNVSRNNGGIGIQGDAMSIIEGNSVAQNQIGLGLDPLGGIARDNVIYLNRGFGMAQTTGIGGTGYTYRENVIRNNNGGNQNPQTDGGIDAGGNYCSGTPGCP